jgi:hypothetical protein
MVKEKKMNHFVRPPQAAKYGTGNGSSYENAWNGMAKIDWKRVKCNDTIHVSGDHVNTETKHKVITIKTAGIWIKGPATFTKYVFTFDGINGLRFEDLTFINSGQFRAEKSTWIYFARCNFQSLHTDNEVFCWLLPGNDDWGFEHCEFSDCGVGIYSRFAGDAPSANRLVVIHCNFHDIGTDAHPHQDGHAIGIQEGHGHRIFHVTTENTGEAISFWSRFNKDMTDIEVSDCTINSVRNKSTTEGGGIVFSGSIKAAQNLPKPGSRANIRILRNRIADTDGNGIRTNYRDAVKIERNEIRDYGQDPRNENNAVAIFQSNPFGAVNTTLVKKNKIY